MTFESRLGFFCWLAVLMHGKRVLLCDERGGTRLSVRGMNDNLLQMDGHGGDDA
jgi:hypothetical protein